MKVEIEVDVPDGWRVVGYRQVKAYDYFMCLPGSISQWLSEVESDDAYLILEKVEPKRESRWANLYHHTSGMLCRSRDECTNVLSGERVSLIRIDYEDGKPVAVTLEPEGEVRDE